MYWIVDDPFDGAREPGGEVRELRGVLKPKIVAEVNDAYVKLVKVKGEFVWHRHETEDELFLVVRGRMHLQTREEAVCLEAGDMAVVPRGTEHRPVAAEEAHVLLIEPKSTLNTGNVQDGRTTEAEWI
ncbi:MAG: cupin domain-containing protein [Thermoplasmata archaeon]